VDIVGGVSLAVNVHGGWCCVGDKRACLVSDLIGTTQQ
jgi:hypothetical protein